MHHRIIQKYLQLMICQCYLHKFQSRHCCFYIGKTADQKIQNLYVQILQNSKLYQLINSFQLQMPYQQSKKFLQKEKNWAKQNEKKLNSEPNAYKRLLVQVGNSEKGNPRQTLQTIDRFCEQTPMMNIGGQKSLIVKAAIEQYQPKTILELGGFCGYSALMMAQCSKALVHTIEPNKQYIEVATIIHKHSGLSDRIIIHQGTLQTLRDFVKDHGKFDLIFIDHWKSLYLPDLKELEQLGAIKKGTIVIGDNIIFPGCPNYHEYFKENNHYDSVLYHSHLQYSNQADAVLVSKRLSD